MLHSRSYYQSLDLEDLARGVYKEIEELEGKIEDLAYKLKQEALG